MKRHYLLVLLCILSALNSKGLAKETSFLDYQEQLTSIIVAKVIPELSKNPKELDTGTVKLTIELDLTGSVRRVDVVSSSSNQFIERACDRVIRSIKFPSIPKTVLAEIRSDFMSMQTEIRIGE